MSLNVISLFPLPDRSQDWTKQELAEFYRVAASLVRGGVSVETGRGRSDEGDPWFVFSQVETGDVIIHFARFDGDYIVASSALGKCVRGRDFRALIETLIESHPLVISTAVGGGRLFVHPAALLVVLVTTCFFKLYPSTAAAEQADHISMPAGNALTKTGGSGSGDTVVVLDERAAATLLAAIAVAVAWGQSDNSDLGFLSAPPTSNVELLAQAVFAATGAPADTFDAFQAYRLYNDGAAGAIGAEQTTAPSWESPLQSVGDGGGEHLPISQNFILGEFSLSGPSSGLSDAGASPSSHSLTLPFSDHAVLFPILNAAAVVATASIASFEVSVAVGASFRSHTVTDLSGSKQKLVLQLATQTVSTHASTIGGTTEDSNGAVITDVSSTANAHSTTANSSAMLPSSVHQAVPATLSPTEVSTTDISSTTNSGGASTATAITQSVGGMGANSPPVVEAAIEHFVAAHPDFQIINYHNELIIYDPHLTPADLPAVSERAFTFQDGSSVVLIGLPSHGHTMHAVV